MDHTESTVLSATGADFQTSVIAASHDRVVLVDFWAEWCGPCKALDPILEEVARSRSDRLKVVKVDVDAERELAQNHGVRALPTLVIFYRGEAAGQLVGLQSAESILAAADRVIAS
jgi:thioredoxin 1